MPGVDDGGYFQRTWGWLALALSAVATLALLLRERVVVGLLELGMLAALAAFTGWTLLSGTWGIAGANAGLEAERAYLYLVALVALVVVVEAGSQAALVGGIVAGVVALVSYGLVDRLVSGGVDPFQGILLAEPVGYANALGILAAIGILLSLGSAVRSWRVRALLLIGTVVLAVGLALTESRGALVALACGLVALAALHPARSRVKSQRAWAVVGAAGAIVVVVITALAVTSPEIGLGDRPRYWEAALDDVGDHPLAGSGAGSFEAYWGEHGDRAINVRDAHSLYLETLAELGVVGVALLVLALGGPLLATRSRLAPAAAAAAAAYVAYLVHAGLDWDWEMPAVTLAGLACAVALLATQRHRRSIVLRARPYEVALGLALAACILSLTIEVA